MQLRDLNVHMTGNAVHATNEVCPNLEFLVLQTGTNVSYSTSLPRLPVTLTRTS